MNDEQLIEFNKRGLIPGPNEELDLFLERAAFCLRLKTDLLKEVTPPDSSFLDSDKSACAYRLTIDLYGIKPDWVPIFFSNWKLAPWHGGAAWIFQLKEDSPLGAILQLRKALYKKSSYLGIYAREELMAHEMAHIGRMAFEEKKYEELLAYRTSKKWFSRYFGPIIQSAFESRLIIYLLATLFLMDMYFLYQGSLSGYLETQAFKLFPLALIVFALFRLNTRQANLISVEKKLRKIVGIHAGAVLYRLTDLEIKTFAKGEQAAICAYMKNNTSLRWRVIRLAYSMG